MKQRLLFIVAFCVIIAALSACGPSGANTSDATPTPTSQPTPTPPVHYKLNQEATISAWKMTITKAVASPADMYNKKGQYLVVSATLKNAGSQTQSVESYANFRLRGTDGTQYSQAPVHFVDTQGTPTGGVETGQSLKGDIVYDVPKDIHNFVFMFVPDINAPATLATWDLKV